MSLGDGPPGPGQSTPPRDVKVAGPGPFSIHPLTPGVYYITVNLYVGIAAPPRRQGPAPGDPGIICGPIEVQEGPPTILQIVLTDQSGFTAGPQNCGGAPSSVTSAHLIDSRIPRPQAATSTGDGCEIFERGECSELRWERLSGIRSGEFTRIRIAPSDPNVIYAAIDANDMSVWKSEDAGDSWTRVAANDHSTDVIVHPTNPDIALYGVQGPEIFRTDDGGNSWQSVLHGSGPGPPGNTMAYAVSQPETLYAAIGSERRGTPEPGGTSAVYRSLDFGATWTTVWEGTELGAAFSIAVSPNDPNVLLVGTNTGICRSTDGGRSWAVVWAADAPGLGKVYSLANTATDPDLVFAGHTEEGVFRSDDGGSTWGQSMQGMTEKKVHEIRIAPSDPRVVYAASHGGIFRSDDGGDTWEERNLGLGFTHVVTLDVHPTNSDLVFAGTGAQNTSNHGEHFVPGFQNGDGLYKTTDGGESWSRSDEGLEAYGIVEVMGDPNLPFRFWLGGKAARGAFMTPDGGDTFLYAPSPGAHYTMVIASGRQPPYPLYMTSVMTGGELMKSKDLGQNWTSLRSSLAEGISTESQIASGYTDSEPSFMHLHGLAVDPNDDDVVYVGSVHDTRPFSNPLSGVHIFKSVDGGDSWMESDQGFPTDTHTAVGFIVVDPADSDVVYVATTEHESETAIGVYKSIDAGESWSPANTGLDNLDIRHLVVDPLDTRLVFAATGAGVFKSTDGAETWGPANQGITTADVRTIAISPANPNVLYAATAEGAFKSKNRGESWYAVNLGLQLAGRVPAMSRHVSLAFDATGLVLFGVAQGEGHHLQAQRFVFRAVLGDPQPMGYTYTIDVGAGSTEVDFESTSAIYDVAFDDASHSLLFTAAGPPGTVGRTTVQIPGTLLSAPFMVTLDGEPLAFDQTGDGTENRITLSYSHSVRHLTIDGTRPALAGVIDRCNQEPVIPPYGYQGLLTDVHVHTSPSSDSDQIDFAHQLLKEMNANGVDRVVIQPNHSPLTVAKNRELDAIWGEIRAVCPRIIPMLYGFDPDASEDMEYVAEALATGQYGGVGGIEFQHGGFDISYDPESENFRMIYEVLQEWGLVLHFQAAFHKDLSGTLGDKLNRIISDRPDLNFVGFGLKDYEEPLSTLENLYWGYFVNSESLPINDGRIARGVIGSDSGPSGFWFIENPELALYQSFGEAMAQARLRLAELPVDVADALAHGNFNQLWPKQP